MSTTPANTAPEVKKPSPVDVFRGNLQRYETDLKALLQIHGVTPEKFITSTMTAVKKEPKLLECDQRTLFAAILVSAELGLAPNTHSGLSFILPYRRKYKEGNKEKYVLEAQFQLGYQGCIEVSLRNPKIESIESGVIYENEEWYFDKGKRDPFSHKPLPPSKRGKPVAAFAIAWLRDNPRPKVVVLYEEDIMLIAKISKAANSEYSPWNKDGSDPFKWMWRKTAIKQLWKELPKTSEMEKAQHIENVAETGGNVRLNDDGQPEIIDTTYMEDLSKQERLESKAASVAEGVKNLRNKKEEPPQDAPKEAEPEGDPSVVDPEDLTPEEQERLKAGAQGKLI